MVHHSSSGGHGGWSCMAVPGLGRKFWTITSCTWPWARCASAMAARARTRSARDSPIPTSTPVVKGMASAPAASQGGQPSLAGSCRGHPGDRPGRGRATRASCPGWRRRGAGGRGRRRRARPRWRGGAAPSRRAPARTWPPGSRRSRRTRARRARRVPRGSASSGASPSVNRASWQPAAAPARATASTSSGDMYGDAHPGRRLGEGAVAAPVATQHRQGDEDLGRVGDPVPVRTGPQRPRLGLQVGEWWPREGRRRPRRSPYPSPSVPAGRAGRWPRDRPGRPPPGRRATGPGVPGRGPRGDRRRPRRRRRPRAWTAPDTVNTTSRARARASKVRVMRSCGLRSLGSTERTTSRPGGASRAATPGRARRCDRRARGRGGRRRTRRAGPTRRS